MITFKGIKMKNFKQLLEAENENNEKVKAVMKSFIGGTTVKNKTITDK